MERKTLSVPSRRDLSLGVSGLEVHYDVTVVTIDIFTLDRLYRGQLSSVGWSSYKNVDREYTMGQLLTRTSPWMKSVPSSLTLISM